MAWPGERKRKLRRGLGRSWDAFPPFHLHRHDLLDWYKTEVIRLQRQLQQAQEERKVAVWLDGRAGMFLVGSARFPCCTILDEPPPYHWRMCLVVQIAAAMTGQDRTPFMLASGRGKVADYNKCVCGRTEVEHGSPPRECRTAPYLCLQYRPASEGCHHDFLDYPPASSGTVGRCVKCGNPGVRP